MGQDLYSTYPTARTVFDEVSRAVGKDVAALCFESTEEELRETQNAQIALFTCGMAAFRALDLGAAAFAGHSVGEYAALAAAQVVTLADGARLVERRGEVMAAAGGQRPGTMAAVLGLERQELEVVCASVEGTCVIANDNCPGQLVISGDVNAVQAASALAVERGAKRALPLNVSGAFHSPLMEDPAREMAVALRTVEFGTGTAPVYSNVTARPVDDPTQWPDLLERQLKSPVLWTGSVHNMISDGFDTFVECGAGEVLSGLIRRIDRDAKCFRVVDPATLEETRAALSG
jgi:[acyl-carrier-protein] S-malonyltransferase